MLNIGSCSLSSSTLFISYDILAVQRVLAKGKKKKLFHKRKNRFRLLKNLNQRKKDGIKKENRKTKKVIKNKKEKKVKEHKINKDKVKKRILKKLF